MMCRVDGGGGHHVGRHRGGVHQWPAGRPQGLGRPGPGCWGWRQDWNIYYYYYYSEIFRCLETPDTFYILRPRHEGVSGREPGVEEYRVCVRGLLLVERKVREPPLVCRPEQRGFHEVRLEIYFYHKINGLI